MVVRLQRTPLTAIALCAGVGVGQDYLALPVSTYVADTTRPELQGFVLDLNEGLLQLTFSETVNTAKLNLSHVCLQKTANWSAPYHT